MSDLVLRDKFEIDSESSAIGKGIDWLSEEKNYKRWLKKFFVPLVKATRKQYGIDVPYHFVPRWYQIDVVEAMYNQRFVVFCMHRRMRPS